jgi:hypothetical protein
MNAVKFWKHRSSALVIFYSTSLLALVLRTVNLVSFFTDTDTRLKLILFVLPGTLTLGLGIAQLNIYSQIIWRVN